jgi:hypothetical protein
MAYPVKEFTGQEYVELASDVYEVMSPEKVYYMPQITDGIASWTINFYNPADEQNPVFTLSDTVIQTGYRVLMTTEISGTVSGQQSHLVSDSGYDNQSNPWVNADNGFQSLPKETVISWTTFTQSYSATINGPYTSGMEYIGTYLDFGQEQPSLPSNNTYVYSQSEDTIVYKYRIYVFNNESEVILNQEFDPATYELTGFLIKNEATIMQ